MSKGLSAIFVLIASFVFAQQFPTKGENIDFIQTFSRQAQTKWGDDDFVQVYFFLIPPDVSTPFYIRVFDPDVGGKYDTKNGFFNSKTRFSVYAGDGCYSNKDARGVDPKGNFRSGIYLDSKEFSQSMQYDNGWYSFGPFNPREGEFVSDFQGFVFKVVVEGQEGDDGNLYRFFLSQKEDENLAVEGGNAFTYEYSIRLKSKPKSVTHLYPFADEKVVSINQFNFDHDNDGFLKLYSVAKNGHDMNSSGDDDWSNSMHAISEEERGKSLNIQIIKKGTFDNDMVFYVTNQYNEPLPFFAIPLGGRPKYKYSIQIEYEQK